MEPHQVVLTQIACQILLGGSEKWCIESACEGNLNTDVITLLVGTVT